MSQKAVLEFFAKVANDTELQQELSDLDRLVEEPHEEVIAKIVGIAEKNGFNFSVDDYISVADMPPEEIDAMVTRLAVPYDCTAATAWQGHPPDPDGCAVAWGCGVQHPMYGGPHIPICSARPV
jgi:hypothetical protein